MKTTLCYTTTLTLVALLAGCGGGGDGPPMGQNAPVMGAIQVLNNTGMDLAGVEIQTIAGSTVDTTGGGLASGATFLFPNLPAGTYDVLAFPPGSGFQQILRYQDIVVSAGDLTDLTMTP